MALFDLDLYLNIHTKEPQISDISQSRFVLPDFFQGDKVPMRLHLLKPDPTGDFNAFERPPIDNLSVKLGVSDQPIGTAGTPTLLVSEFSWTKDVDEDIFSAVVNFNTTEINTFLGSEFKKTAYLEIEVTDSSNSAIYTILQKEITLKAQVVEPASSSVPAGETPLSLEMATGLFVPYRLAPGRTITFVDESETWDCIIGTNTNGDFVSEKAPA